MDLRLKEVEDRISERKMTLDVDDLAKQYLVSVGYSTVYGARPLNRVVKTHILDPLSRAILSLSSESLAFLGVFRDSSAGGAIKDEEVAKVEMRDNRMNVVENHVVEDDAPLASTEVDEEDEE